MINQIINLIIINKKIKNIACFFFIFVIFHIFVMTTPFPKKLHSRTCPLLIFVSMLSKCMTSFLKNCVLGIMNCMNCHFIDFCKQIFMKKFWYNDIFFPRKLLGFSVMEIMRIFMKKFSIMGIFRHSCSFDFLVHFRNYANFHEENFCLGCFRHNDASFSWKIT